MKRVVSLMGGLHTILLMLLIGAALQGCGSASPQSNTSEKTRLPAVQGQTRLRAVQDSLPAVQRDTLLPAVQNSLPAVQNNLPAVQNTLPAVQKEIQLPAVQKTAP